MTVTIYEPFDKLIASLRHDGLLKESDILYHRMYIVAWTTGSELLVLRSLIKSAINLVMEGFHGQEVGYL